MSSDRIARLRSQRIALSGYKSAVRNCLRELNNSACVSISVILPGALTADSPNGLLTQLLKRGHPYSFSNLHTQRNRIIARRVLDRALARIGGQQTAIDRVLERLEGSPDSKPFDTSGWAAAFVFGKLQWRKCPIAAPSFLQYLVARGPDRESIQDAFSDIQEDLVEMEKADAKRAFMIWTAWWLSITEVAPMVARRLRRLVPFATLISDIAKWWRNEPQDESEVSGD